MYKVKRFSKEGDKKIEKPNKGLYAAQGAILGITGAEIGKDIGANRGRKKFNKWVDKGVNNLVNKAAKGDAKAAETISKLRHPETLDNFKKIANKVAESGAKKGKVIGAGAGLAYTGAGYLYHKKKSKDSK